MDSLSQIVLGAATFAIIKDKEIGKKALLYGAILGTIPDLDVVLSPFFNPIEQLAIHRAFSHSIFFSLLLSLLFAKWFSHKYKTSYMSWFWASFIALFTHPLLDICTTYGTRILYPLSKSFYSLDNVFVIDPLYTIWLLIGCIILLFMKRNNPNRPKVIKWSLFLSTTYLIFGLIVHFYVMNNFKKELKRQNIVYEKIKVVPTPFNTILWQGIVKTKEGFYYADYSLLDSKTNTDFHFEKNDVAFIESKKNIEALEPFFNFTEGYALAREEKGKMYIYGTKFGPINIENGQAEFFFPVVFNSDGTYETVQRQPDNYKELFERLISRLKGN
ncbi:metal-dependent hydrolase [Flavobacterium jejuense]|uniref:Metal-dependent hydrolase n=1 Tax=Flavobacterium jejuense TaxID=1544455 RepID=A0ABX0J1E1_9FLAO|nr:metal-dependent hydrolase [Flavobacterium jejuense]NHN27789.1 metal-dependent hydrolase [Flavobacterium jejuense]